MRQSCYSITEKPKSILLTRKNDLEQGTAPGSTGPFRKELNEYGQKGRVIAPVVGAFAEMSPDTYAIADLISSVLANEHGSFFADKPSEAKGMFTQRLYRSLGLAAHLGWARLLVGRYRDLVEVPAPGGLVVAATTSPPTTKTRSSTRTTTTPVKSISMVGDLCFNACFSQLEPKPPSGGGETKKNELQEITAATQY
jgi:hypothetical protein